MLRYLKMFVTFILSIMMYKNDYNFFHKDFKPLRVAGWIMSAFVLSYSVYITDAFHSYVAKIQEVCPDCNDRIKNAKAKKKADRVVENK